MFNFRTDLALERRELYRKANKIENEIDGIETEEEEIGENIKVSRVKVIDKNGEEALAKPIGDYITIDIKKLKIATDEDIGSAAEVLTKELKGLLEKHVSSKDDVLVVGLGNIYVTPDSLGPKVINEIDVTRHIQDLLVQFLQEF